MKLRDTCLSWPLYGVACRPTQSCPQKRQHHHLFSSLLFSSSSSFFLTCSSLRRSLPSQRPQPVFNSRFLTRWHQELVVVQEWPRKVTRWSWSCYTVNILLSFMTSSRSINYSWYWLRGGIFLTELQVSYSRNWFSSLETLALLTLFQSDGRGQNSFPWSVFQWIVLWPTHLHQEQPLPSSLRKGPYCRGRGWRLEMEASAVTHWP